MPAFLVSLIRYVQTPSTPKSKSLQYPNQPPPPTIPECNSSVTHQSNSMSLQPAPILLDIDTNPLSYNPLTGGTFNPTPASIHHNRNKNLHTLATCPIFPEPAQYNRELYKRRNEIERLFRRLKGFRRIFSRFEKLDALFLGFIHFALIYDAVR